MLPTSYGNAINRIAMQPSAFFDEATCKKLFDDLLRLFFGDASREPYFFGACYVFSRHRRQHSLLVAQQQGRLVIGARHYQQWPLAIPKPQMSLCVELDHELMDSLTGDAQHFGKLISPPRAIQQCEQAPTARTSRCAVAPGTIRNDFEATASATLRCPPPVHLVPFRQAKSLELAESF